MRNLARYGAVALTAALLTGTGAAPAAPLTPHTDPAEATSPLDLVSADLGQDGTTLHLALRTAKPFLSTVLDPASGRSLCVVLNVDADAVPDERLCAISDTATHSGLSLRLTRLSATGAPTGIRTLKATVGRPDGRTVTAEVPWAGIGLAPGMHKWQAVTRWQDDAACLPQDDGVSPCVDQLPDAGVLPLPIRALRAIGCGYRGPAQFRHGSGNRIALTFDDGPAAITKEFLKVLEREHVPATFFVLGDQVGSHPELLRRMLADGDMIGNHSYDHANLGAGGPAAAAQLSRTQAIIRRATRGFTPCLFRPPYGSTSANLVQTAGAQRLTTILWDVDPTDWANPGAAAVQSRVIAQAHPGSIVLSHDGGGPRSGTLAALPGEIREFKRRGYKFVTVNELLGLDLILK